MFRNNQKKTQNLPPFILLFHSYHNQMAVNFRSVKSRITSAAKKCTCRKAWNPINHSLTELSMLRIISYILSVLICFNRTSQAVLCEWNNIKSTASINKGSEDVPPSCGSQESIRYSHIILHYIKILREGVSACVCVCVCEGERTPKVTIWPSLLPL